MGEMNEEMDELTDAADGKNAHFSTWAESIIYWTDEFSSIFKALL